jgi:hypothetical protein
MTLSPPFWHVLDLLLTRLDGQPIIWALTGSTAFALQGVSVSPGDIDVQSNADGAYKIERLFAEYSQKLVTFSATSQLKSHFGSLMIDGVKVEVIGELQKKVNGVWEPPPNLQKLQRVITVQGYQIPVLDLSYEIESYRKMGREETAALLRPFQHATHNNHINS